MVPKLIYNEQQNVISVDFRQPLIIINAMSKELCVDLKMEWPLPPRTLYLLSKTDV